MNTNDYLLAVGEKGEKRLALLNELFAPVSHDFLLHNSLTEGQHILEVACGTGIMTCWIAEKVGPSGHVTAIDISIEQIAIAEKRAKENGLHNITFIPCSVFELKDLPLFDMIYSRFILMHLSQPYDALRKMWQFLKTNGKMICEEAANSVTYHYPPCEAYQKYRKLLLMLANKKGLDFELGEKIYTYFHDLKLKNISVNFVQPILHTPQEKQLIILMIHEIKHHFMSYGLATEEEVDQILNGILVFINNDRHLISFPRTTQICGQKS